MIAEKEFFDALESRLDASDVKKLRESTVGVAGLGGLGSNIAMMLARTGIGRLVIADDDIVELTNIHRQAYPLDSVGKRKVDAVADEIARINPWCEVERHFVRFDRDSVSIFSGCDVVCEAFDGAQDKIALIESLSAMGRTVVSGNGMAGKGPANTIVTKKVGDSIYICGDGVSDVGTDGSLMPSRVMVCAAHQANAVVRIILGMEP